MDIHYNAFISYRHHPVDIKVAEQIHRGLEHYRIPKTLKKNRDTKLRLFRDKEELPITSNLSGSYASAVQAAEEYMNTHPGAKVHVIDSLSTGPEMILLIERLKEMIQENLSFESIKGKIYDYLKKTHLLFSLQSLTNLARNGRVSPTVAKVAGVLGIRVVGKASDEGTLEPLHKCRGEKKALDSILSEMIAHGFSGAKVHISHCINLESANELKQLILRKFPGSDIQISKCGGLCSYYAEIGGLLIGFES
jgi:DegV family protein with EDD domain